MRNFIERDWKLYESSILFDINEKKINYCISESIINSSNFPSQSAWKEEKRICFDNEKPHLWFDNFSNIDKIQFNDLKIMQYTDLDVFKVYNHPPVITSLKKKPGAPQELAFKKEIYPIDDLIQLRDGLSEDFKEISKNSKAKAPPKEKKVVKKGQKKPESTDFDSDNIDADDIFAVEPDFNDEEYNPSFYHLLINFIKYSFNGINS